MDSLSYHYYPGTNRLNHVTDQVAAASFGNGQNDVADIDNQNAGNYHYDETGNLVKDLAEGIDKITWTVYGKIASIEKSGGTNIFYTYDPSGNRISKLVQRNGGDKNYTWYVRDAQGNVMATYTAKGNATELSDLELKLSERHLYGSSRLGILTETVDVDNNNTGPVEVEEIKLISYYRGYRQYELSNHLGNVLATVSDKKSGIDHNSDEEIDYFEPEIITASDYYPFGMLMPARGGSLINGQWQNSGPAILAALFVSSRTGNQPDEYIALESIEFLPGFESGSADEFVAYITTSGIGDSEGTDGLYRYGFNGKENDNETGTQDYGFRIYNPGLGRFLSVDPISKDYPELTPFQFASNSPIQAIDIDGLEGGWALESKNQELKIKGETMLTQIGDKKLFPKIEFSQPTLRTNRKSTPYEEYVSEKMKIKEYEKLGWNSDGTLKPLTQLQENKTWNNFSDNLALPLINGYSVITGIWSLGKYAFTLRSTSSFGSNGLKISTPSESSLFPNNYPRMGGNRVTTGFRYMTEGELKTIQQSGLLSGGNPGSTYFTKDLYKSGVDAQQRLSLPTTPTIRVEFEILNKPTMRLNGSKVLPDFGMPGRGAEFMTTDPVKVRLINWQPLR